MAASSRVSLARPANAFSLAAGSVGGDDFANKGKELSIVRDASDLSRGITE